MNTSGEMDELGCGNKEMESHGATGSEGPVGRL